MHVAGRRSAGFSLLEVMIVLAITLTVSAVLFQTTRSTWQAYRALTHQAERGLSGLRALDDMAVEIARAGFGLRDDGEPLWPGRPGGVPASDAITLRSNPTGVAGAEREVQFWLKTAEDGVAVVARKATGQKEQVLARHVAFLRFDYLDDRGEAVAYSAFGASPPAGAVRITVRLGPDPALPPVSVPPLSLLVPLETQSATVSFDLRGPVFYTVGVSGIVGREPGSERPRVRLHAWKKTGFGS
ncbi:MAG TPA: prepilin-type N-terminal cleavage/methylation domain-containing protein [Vicinamibacteria bacterium]|nr:prepilin-type N-terminal cleavage/methylation domain-containing protein [Vicinamibacteria bacterium]